MQLPKLKAYFAAYTDWLQTPAAEQRLHYWESQAIWQQQWDMETTDFASMYDSALQNSKTKRLWKREAYEPKRMMMQFAQRDPHFVFSMFNDLFNQDKDAHSRADRFIFYCNQLFQQYQRDKPMALDTGHYHNDGYEIISLYLSFQYPAHYAPYKATRFLELLRRVGAANVPPAGDFPRHIKVMRTLQILLNKEPELLAAHQRRLRSNHFKEESYLLAFDFACFVVKEKK